MSTRQYSTTHGYMPLDKPPAGAMLSLGFQQVLTMFPATVLVAILTKFDVGATLLTSGLGTIIALLVSKGRIPLYYGSSFSYIAVVISAMNLFVPDCFNNPAVNYCGEGVRLVQVGILGTALVEIAIGLLIMRLGKAALDKILPPIITGSVAVVIGIALAGAALNNAASGGPVFNQNNPLPAEMAGIPWFIAFVTLAATVAFSVYLQNRGLLGMLPILLGAAVGYVVSIPFGLVNFDPVLKADWFAPPRVTLPAFEDPRAWSVMASIALIAIATIPESTAHLYQMSLYIDALAKQLGRAPMEIKKLIGLNLVADGAQDAIAGLLGGAAGTNYGENNSLMAITRNYSSWVLAVAGAIAIALAFIGKLAALIGTIPIAVTGGLAIYLFGVIGMQGVALIQSEKVNLFEPRNLAIGAIILVAGIGGSMAMPNGLFPFQIPLLFPNGIPAIVFAAMLGILFNLLFVVLPPRWFGVQERENLN
ncbi:MAG: solute carrier family 23 protein [Anaerolineae bacterium]|nr:hypothetical protein [Thermoflexales bacterium]MDW8407582.1 solute carrier family 23 protein [Anaerolineae bacterium]